MNAIMVLWLFVTPILAAALLFGLAGRVDLPFVWVGIGVTLTAGVATALVIDEDLARERLRPGPGGLDRRMPAQCLPALLAHLIVAGLDARCGWSGPVPVWLKTLGAAGLAGGMATLVISLAHNRFFSPVVRVQAERGHRVVTSGPYALVRHPGYAGALLALPSAALTLGSYWSALPLAVVALLIVRRAAIEDAFLLRELDGYSAYAARVRYRLVPFLW